MSDFNSKYTGNQVEALLDIVSQGGSGGGGEGGEVQKTTETEILAMGFTKNLGTITEVKMNGVSKGTEGVVDLGMIPTTAEVAAKYTKPSDGIPASDLAPDVFLQGEKGEKGDQGEQGPQGIQGPKGDQGEKGADGAQGPKGDNGTDGEDGATFTPNVDAEGNLSWTNDKGLSNPPTVNIKGPKGDSGEGGGSSYAGNYPVVRTEQTSLVLSSNTYYIFENIYGGGDALNIEGFSTQDNNVVNEFIFEVTIKEDNLLGGNSASFYLPSSVVWQNNEHPPMTTGKTYIISIVNNLAVYAEF